VNLLDATKLAAETQPDYRLTIEREIFQVVDSGATSAPAVPVIDLDDFLLDEDFLSDDDDDELFQLPPVGAAAWVAPAVPRPPAPTVPVLGLDAFPFGVNESVQLLPGGLALSLDRTLGPVATVDLVGPFTMLSRTYGFRCCPRQMLDRIQLQEVLSYVASSNGTDINGCKLYGITNEAQRLQKRFLRVDIDFKSAFNSMSQASLWTILEAYDSPDIDLLKYFYEYTTVRLPQTKVETPKSHSTQGCPRAVFSLPFCLSWSRDQGVSTARRT
jgi:hypothetical protein